MKKINQKKVDEIVKNVEDKDKEISWEEGQPKFKSKKNISRGKKSKAQGSEFERRVRKDLESKGRFVDKWSNNLDLEKGKIVPARKIFNPFKKIMVPGAGFPDFIVFREVHDGLYGIIGVEVKMNGLLSKEEKQKCKWYLENKIFSEIWVAKKEKEKNKIKISYIDFNEKYMKEKQNK